MSKSRYPNRTELAIQILKKLETTGGKCEICHSWGACIHHKDGSKDNHSETNLLWLCYKCHNNLHKDGKLGPKKTSKYSRLYGKTFLEIVRLSKLSDKTVWMVLNFPRKVRTSTLNTFLKNTGIELEDLISNTVPKDLR